MPDFKLAKIKPVRVSEEKMINFHDVTDYLEKEKNIDYRDMSGIEKWRVEAKTIALEKFGFNMDKPSHPQFTKMTPKENEFFDFYYKNMPEKQDCWVWLLDEKAFGYDFIPGEMSVMDLNAVNAESTPDYMKVFLREFIEAVKDSEAYDKEENTVNVFIDW